MARSALLLPSNNFAITATESLATGTAHADFPLTHVNDGLITKVLKLTAAGIMRIVFDLGSAKQVDGVFIPKSNFPAGLDVRWQGHTSSSWGTPDVDVPVVIPTHRSMGPVLPALPEHVWASTMNAYDAAGRTKRYWSLYVPAFASAPALTEVLFGTLSVFDAFIQGPNEDGEALASIVKTPAFGGAWSLRYPVELPRQFSLQVGLEEDTKALFRVLHGEVGTDADPFVLVPDISKSRALWVRAQEMPITMLVDGYYTAPATFIKESRGLPL